MIAVFHLTHWIIDQFIIVADNVADLHGTALRSTHAWLQTGSEAEKRGWFLCEYRSRKQAAF
jgi:hypothetical protein